MVHVSRATRPAFLVALAGLAVACTAEKGGARITREGSGYALVLSHAPVGRGGSGTATVRVTGRGGFKVNTKYPQTRLTLQGAAPLLPKRLFEASEATAWNESELRFMVPFKLDGDSASTGVRLKFSVCNERECLTPTEEFRWDLTAAALVAR